MVVQTLKDLKSEEMLVSGCSQSSMSLKELP